jgi:hypothetical protein
VQLVRSTEYFDRFICLGSPASATFCRKVRTYKSSERRLDITVVDAVRATCAPPRFPVRVGTGPLRLEVISWELAFSNPIREAIKEAHEHYGAHCKVSCVLSLGCGRQVFTLEDAKQDHSIEESLSRNAALAGERIATEMELQIGISNVYHRFSVDRGLGFSESTSLDPGQITDRTHAYLADPKVSKEFDTCVSVSLGDGLCVLDDICASVVPVCISMLTHRRSIAQPNVLLYGWNTSLIQLFCYEKRTHGDHLHQASISTPLGSLGYERNREDSNRVQVPPQP